MSRQGAMLARKFQEIAFADFVIDSEVPSSLRLEERLCVTIVLLDFVP